MSERHVKEAKLNNITQQITRNSIKLQHACHIDKAIAKESNRSIDKTFIVSRK